MGLVKPKATIGSPCLPPHFQRKDQTRCDFTFRPAREPAGAGLRCAQRTRMNHRYETPLWTRDGTPAVFWPRLNGFAGWRGRRKLASVDPDERLDGTVFKPDRNYRTKHRWIRGRERTTDTCRYEGAKTMKKKVPTKKSGSGDNLSLDSCSGMSDPCAAFSNGRTRTRFCSPLRSLTVRRGILVSYVAVYQGRSGASLPRFVARHTVSGFTHCWVRVRQVGRILAG